MHSVDKHIRDFVARSTGQSHVKIMTQAPLKCPAQNRRDRKGNDLFRRLAREIPQALWIRDGEAFCYVNPAWQKLTGRPLNAGDPTARLYDAFHPDDRLRLINDAERFPNGGSDLDCRLLRPDGTLLWVRMRTFAIAGSPEEPLLLVGIMDDITALRSESRRTEQRMNDFVSTVSHELRAPLTSISGSLGLLAGNAAWQMPAPAERLLGIAYANSQRLVRLVNDILDIEKIESGSVVFARKRVKVRALVEQAIEANRGFAAGYDVRIQLDVTAAECEVDVDPDRFVQVVTNLLSNAVKFSSSGANVEVAIVTVATMVQISVRDYGSGIPDAFKPRVFERFARAETSEARQKGGTGLGLSIANEIVTRLGGTLTFADAPGGGTIFHIALPLPSAESGSAFGGPDAIEREVA